MTMNLPQARVGDPVLTNHARGFKQRRFVGSHLFPAVPVKLRGGKIVEFDKAAFVRHSLRRIPGGDAREITFGHQGAPYQLVQDSLDVKLPRELAEDAQRAAGIDMSMRAVKVGISIMTQGLEIEQAQLASDASRYTASHKLALAGAAKWSDAASDPFVDVAAANEVIRADTGMRANTLILGPKPFSSLTNHPKVRARFSGISADAVQEQQLAAVFGLNTVAEGAAVYTESEDVDAPFLDIWGNVAVLAYVPPEGEVDGVEEPSFGYTYTMEGHPYARAPYWDDKKRSWMHPVDYERAPVLCGALAGFLFTDVA
jgi:hypothetical protein